MRDGDRTRGQITRWLGELREGDREALDRLMPVLYGELRKVAAGKLRGERSGHTLSTTALVNEAYLKLLMRDEIYAADRTQFLAVASDTMRRILVDYARARKRQKRGGESDPIPLEDAEAFMTAKEADELLALNDALDRLGTFDAKARRVVEYRFFGGLTLEETAQVLDVSTKTVQRSWTSARLWLRKEVNAELDL